MTLRQIKSILDSTAPANAVLEYDFKTNKLSNLNVFRGFFHKIEALPFSSEKKDFIRNSLIFSTSGDHIFSADSGYAVKLASDELINAAKLLREVLESILPPENEQSIAIKLPPESDLASLINDLSKINTGISQNIINKEIAGVVEVRSWHPGSLWIEIYVGSQAAMTLIAGIAWAAAVVRKKWHEASIMQKIADSMEIKNETLTSLSDGVQRYIQLLIESEAKNLLAHNFSEDDNHEQVERLKLAIKTFTDLIERGAEVHASLQAPEQVKNLFPDFAKLDTIESKMKLLAEHAQASPKQK